MGLSEETFGAILIGAFLTMGLYGITTLQTYFYYSNYPKDSTDLKILVYTTWILDTLHIILMCHALYFYLITNFGNPPALKDGTWSLFGSVTVNIVLAFIVQAFFTQRIHVLTPSPWRWWVSGIIGFTVVAHFAFGLETIIILTQRKAFTALNKDSISFTLPFAIFVVLSDVLIAAALCILLNKGRSEYEDTNSIINKLMIYSINRCILICIVAIVECVVFLARPHSFYAFAVDFTVGKLYANSLLASLNSRKSLRGRGELDSTDVSTSFNLASLPNRTVTSQQSRHADSASLDQRLIMDGKEDAESTPVTQNTASHRTSVTRRSGVGNEV